MKVRPSLPPLDPAMNPGSFGSGRGVFEIEEEMVKLYCNLPTGLLRRLLSRNQWRLWHLHQKYWPTNARDAIAARDRYSQYLREQRT